MSPVNTAGSLRGSGGRIGTIVNGVFQAIGATAQAFTPAALPNLAAWWKVDGAAADGANVATVPSGSGGTALTPGGTTRAVYRANGFVTGRPGLQFTPDASGAGGPAYGDGTPLNGAAAMTFAGTFMIPASGTLTGAQMTLAGRELVFKLSVEADLRPSLFLSTNGTGWALITYAANPLTRGVPYYYTITVGGGQAILRINGTQILSAAFAGPLATSSAPFYFGGTNAAGAYPLAGILGDHVLVSAVLSTADRLSLEAWLAASIATAPVAPVAGNLYAAAYASMEGADTSVYSATPHGTGITPTFDTTWFDAGKQSLRLTAGTSASNDAGQAFTALTVATGDNIRFKAAVRRGNGTTPAQASVKWRTASGTLIYETTLQSITTTVGNITQVDSTQTAPAGAALAQLIVRYITSAPAAGNYLQVDSLAATRAAANPNNGATGGTTAPRATAGTYAISGTRVTKDGVPFKVVGANIGVNSAIGGNYTSEENISAHTAEAIQWGWNTIRLHVYVSTYTSWINTLGKAEAYRQIFACTDKYLAAGFIVILTPMDQTAVPNISENATAKADIADFFTQAANRYKTESRVWYNVNEPVNVYNATLFQAFQKTFYDAVRGTGCQSIYVADFLANSQDGRYVNQTKVWESTLGPAFLTNSGGTPRTNVLFSLHNYGGQIENNWGQSLSNDTYNAWADAVVAAGLAFITGETGFPVDGSGADFQRNYKGFYSALQQRNSNGIVVWSGTNVDLNTLKAERLNQYQGQSFWYQGAGVNLSEMGLAFWNWCHAYTSPSTAPVGNDLPGWALDQVQDFTAPAVRGQVGAVYGTDMRGYSGFTDTSHNGTYDPDQVLSVVDGNLVFDLRTINGKPSVACPIPFGYTGLTYGRYAIRFKATTTGPGYKVAFMLWPSSDSWNDGETDFPEGDLDGTIGGYVHVPGNPSQNALAQPTSATFTSWHTSVIEWTPAGTTFFLDGVQIGTTTTSPSKPMRLTLQAETTLSGSAPAAGVTAQVLVDWVAQWRYSPTGYGSSTYATSYGA